MTLVWELGLTYTEVPKAEHLEVLALSTQNPLVDLPLSLSADDGEIGRYALAEEAHSTGNAGFVGHGGREMKERSVFMYRQVSRRSSRENECYSGLCSGRCIG